MQAFGLIAMSRGGHRAVMKWLECVSGEPVLNIESQRYPASLRKAKEACVDPIMLIRDFPNWAASVASHYSPFVNSPAMVDTWIDHARHAFEIPTILFPEWVRAGHGDEITIGDSTNFDGGSLLTRYKQIGDDPVYLRMMERGDALRLNAQLFPEMAYAA